MLFGQRAQVCSYWFKLIVVCSPLDVLFEPQLLLDGHRFIPSGQRAAAPIRRTASAFCPPTSRRNRWDAAGERWILLLDWLPHSMQNLYGGESIAIDPSNPRNVYFAGGMFDWWPGGPWDVLKSTDQGKTWERTNPTGPRRLGERWTPGVLAPTGHHKPRPTRASADRTLAAGRLHVVFEKRVRSS